MEHIIITNNLSKKYKDAYRVKDVDLKIPKNTVYGFLGPNGAGKSTTLKMILGLVKPTEGSITVFGKVANDKNRLEILRDVGSLIESPSYYGHLTAVENLKIVQTLRDVPEKNINKVLEIVRLDNQKIKK
ncbi:ABC-type multidrug transport system ATPase subunit [Clostridium beijerinckii]|nr:ABC-type multidrug transport system ATPase subunit [Clostridium beijerinckii]